MSSLSSVRSKVDIVDVIRKLGGGAKPSSLGLGHTSEGYVDLRGVRLPTPTTVAEIETPLGPVDCVRDKPIFRRCTLRKVDMSGASLAGSYWQGAHWSDTKLDRADLRHTIVASGRIEGASFRKADLRGSGWGVYWKAGPVVSDSDFTDTDMRHTTYAHPLFRNCRFINSRLDEVDFRGSRFEACVFEGTLSDVWFRGSFRDPNPLVARLRNRMRNVDFSRAELVFPSFLDVDLSSCKLPSEGHLRIPRPRLTYRRALEIVEREWTGDAGEKAKSYLGKMLQYQFPTDTPLYVFRPKDLSGSPLGREIAEGVTRELERAAKELGLSA